MLPAEDIVVNREMVYCRRYHQKAPCGLPASTPCPWDQVLAREPEGNLMSLIMS